MPPLNLPTIESSTLTPNCCDVCRSERLIGEVCLICTLCQKCLEVADSCSCEVNAYDRYIDAQYLAYLEAKENFYC